MSEQLPSIGYKARHDHFKEIGKQMNICLERYGNACERSDFPWRYSERPLVGMLSAAVWLSGGVSLEEYWTKKRKSDGKSYGRIDLFFKINESSYIAEAKHKYINISDCVGKWRYPLVSLCKRDAGMNVLGRGEFSVGVAFWSVRYSRTEVNVAQKVAGLIDGLRADDADFTLWHFPSWALFRDHGEKQIRYAGLVMQIIVTSKSKV